MDDVLKKILFLILVVGPSVVTFFVMLSTSKDVSKSSSDKFVFVNLFLLVAGFACPGIWVHFFLSWTLGWKIAATIVVGLIPLILMGVIDTLQGMEEEDNDYNNQRSELR